MNTMKYGMDADKTQIIELSIGTKNPVTWRFFHQRMGLEILLGNVLEFQDFLLEWDLDPEYSWEEESIGALLSFLGPYPGSFKEATQHGIHNVPCDWPSHHLLDMDLVTKLTTVLANEPRNLLEPCRGVGDLTPEERVVFAGDTVGIIGNPAAYVVDGGGSYTNVYYEGRCLYTRNPDGSVLYKGDSIAPSAVNKERHPGELEERSQWLLKYAVETRHLPVECHHLTSFGAREFQIPSDVWCRVSKIIDEEVRLLKQVKLMFK